MIEQYTKNAIVDFIRGNNVPVTEIGANLTEIANAVRAQMEPFWQRYGLALPGFYVTNVDIDESEQIGRKIIEARQQYNKNAPIRMPVFFSIGIKTIDLSAYAGRDLHAEEKEEALGIFYQSIQDADMLMQENKRLARAEHYGLVQAYIEKSLNHPISLSDNRLF